MEWLKQIFSGGDSVVPELPGYSAPLRNADLPTQWKHEVHIMRSGSEKDWQDWSTACRASWAGMMLRITNDRGFWEDAPVDDIIWLLDHVEPEYEAMPVKEQELARWFQANLNRLPRKPFSLLGGQEVGVPVGWYLKITLALIFWSSQRPSWQDVVCGWLEQLRLYVGFNERPDHENEQQQSINLNQVDSESILHQMPDLFMEINS